MALLDILEFPDPRLRTKAKPVDTARVAGPGNRGLGHIWGKVPSLYAPKPCKRPGFQGYSAFHLQGNQVHGRHA